MAIRAIFFDIGDTLVFDHPPLIERLATAALAVGIPLDSVRLPAAFRAAEAFAVERYVRGIAWDAPGALRETVAVLWASLGLLPMTDGQWAAFGAAFAAVPFVRAAHPEAQSLLADLKERGFTLGAISDWEDTLPDVLTELGLLPYFDALAISAVVGVTKPNPVIFEDALGQVGFASEECLHIGDWYELDAAGAMGTGMHALLFDWAGRAPAAACPRVTTWEQMAAYLAAL